jgi:hypothetical protein
MQAVLLIRSSHTALPSLNSRPSLHQDRLYDTLEQRLRRWHGKIRKYSGLGGKLLVDRQGSKAAALYEERMVASYELSAAFAHLHDRHLVYRDIKPENIGFDIVSVTT